MSSIITYYNDLRFRSRIEAKWACFFDLLNLDWKYEPQDLIGYIPDFIVDSCLLVEIKGDCKSIDNLQKYTSKIIKSGWLGPWLLCGDHYLIQLGQQLVLPPDAKQLWNQACNETQWFPDKKNPIKITNQVPSFNPQQFETHLQPLNHRINPISPCLPK